EKINADGSFSQHDNGFNDASLLGKSVPRVESTAALGAAHQGRSVSVRVWPVILFTLLGFWALWCAGNPARAEPRAASGQSEPGTAILGAPALPADFRHLPYVNPDAPKGGRITFGLLGTFDSLNPLIVKGVAVQQIRGYVVESLLTRSQDEPFTLYGLLAQRVE